ncbi:MAG: HDOD domain-containing protein [Gallionellaceae bacterium]|nr:HDOD domain-containing protein [Gallionellaceae bacterium]
MLNSEQDIHRRLALARLPVMPHILITLMDCCQSEEMELDDFANLIAKDAAVSMRVMGAVNGSAYSPYSHKPGLRQAVLALGMENLRTLLISEAVFQVLNNFNHPDDTDLRGFWRHSYTAALAARKIAALTDYPYLEEAYLAGLLHDVGRLALLAVAPQEYSMLLSHVDDAGLGEAEKQTFQITHCEAGAWLIDRFQLDSFIADSVRYHHQPLAQVATAHPLIGIVLLADLIACHGTGEPSAEAAQQLFNLDAAALLEICQETEQEVKQAAVSLHIDLVGTEQAMAVPYPSKRARDDSQVRERLVLEVQQVILAAETGRAFAYADDEISLMGAVAGSADLQFGFANILFLMHDEPGRCLRGVALKATQQSVAEFSIPLADSGAVAVAAQQRQVAFIAAASSTLSLADEQLFRLLNTQHLVCLPLLAKTHNLGVIIAATVPYRLDELRTRVNFLRMFSGQAATALDALHTKALESAQLAEEYRQASRWVIHEASNPLSIIKNYLLVLDSKIKRKESIQAEVAIISQEIDRVGKIIQGFAGIQVEATKEMLGVNHIVAEVIKFLEITNYIPSAIHIQMQLQDEADEVKVDSNALKQILVNLIKNAVEAMPEGGEVVVATPHYVNRDGHLYCVLTIQDNGPGIAPPVLAKLFSPIRSAKSGDHAGLGLSIVHRLVQDMGGMIMCRSNGSGTAFEILLPVNSASSTGIENKPEIMGGRYGRD